MFDRVYLINLKKRTDRLANFRALQINNGWKLPEPIVFEAIEGDKVGVPSYFSQGGGAYGCLRSHTSILERCIMDGVSSVLMMEDDITWQASAWDQLDAFIKAVPSDWSQLMLGGQHIGRDGGKVAEGVVSCRDCERTHAYALRGPAIKSLLGLWYTCNVHIDWWMGRKWQPSHKVYAPSPFIFGQAAGRSDISGRTNPPLFWSAQATDIPVVWLDAPPEVVAKLRGYGLHTGHDRDEEDYDRGLAKFAHLSRKDTHLRRWLDTILWECANDPGSIAAVWHPALTLEDVRRVHPSAIAVRGPTVEECLDCLSAVKLRSNLSASHCLLLRAPREVIDGLAGFHRGYWLDAITGQDNGLRAAAVARDKTPKLLEWFAAVGAEAEKMNAVPVVWHEAISLEDLLAATDRKVIEIAATSVEEVLLKWKEAT